jgi:uncharacterized protein
MNKDFLLLGIVTVMSLAANLPDNILSMNGLDRKLLVFGLLFVVCIALIRYSKFALVLAIAILALGANLPGELANALNVEPRVMMMTLAAVVLFSLANRVLRLPTGLENPQGFTYQEGSQALLRAVIKGRATIVERLIKAGANVNARSPQGYTLLMIAAARGNQEITNILLDLGADFAIVDPQGRNALQHAREGNHENCVELLLAASKAEVNNTQTAIPAA